MEKEDKIAFAVLSVLICGIIFGALLLVKYLGSSLFGFFDASSAEGLGFKEAFLYGTGVSVLLNVVFAMFAGDGLLGELPTMVISFFLFVVFFTISIAWIF